MTSSKSTRIIFSGPVWGKTDRHAVMFFVMSACILIWPLSLRRCLLQQQQQQQYCVSPLPRSVQRLAIAENIFFICRLTKTPRASVKRQLQQSSRRNAEQTDALKNGKNQRRNFSEAHIVPTKKERCTLLEFLVSFCCVPPALVLI